MGWCKWFNCYQTSLATAHSAIRGFGSCIFLGSMFGHWRRSYKHLVADRQLLKCASRRALSLVRENYLTMWRVFASSMRRSNRSKQHVTFLSGPLRRLFLNAKSAAYLALKRRVGTSSSQKWLLANRTGHIVLRRAAHRATFVLQKWRFHTQLSHTICNMGARMGVHHFDSKLELACASGLHGWRARTQVKNIEASHTEQEFFGIQSLELRSNRNTAALLAQHLYHSMHVARLMCLSWSFSSWANLVSTAGQLSMLSRHAIGVNGRSRLLHTGLLTWVQWLAAQRFAKMSEQYKHSQAELEAQMRATLELKSAIDVLGHEKGRLEAEMDRAMSTSDMLRSKSGQLEADNSVLEAALMFDTADLKARLDAASSQSELLKSKTELLAHDKHELESKISSMHSANEELQSRADSLEKEKSRLEDESLWTGAMQQLHVEGITNLQLQIDEVESEQDALKKQHHQELTQLCQRHAREIQSFSDDVQSMLARLDGLATHRKSCEEKNDSNRQHQEQVDTVVLELQEMFTLLESRKPKAEPTEPIIQTVTQFVPVPGPPLLPFPDFVPIVRHGSPPPRVHRP
eukprot:TRINITY_DN5149_c0_g1_i4.p1 TRINITY_DN5149_c0_g1~~TRINITY_DN5149_c0_g1_i4.p1  ORF type:complete len:575 (+),score=107.08 TRINITY_DN5149_c0_g1_i4:603-2327(+)